jgi:hypothetical protein
MAFIAVTVLAQNLQFSSKEHRFPTLRETDKEVSCSFSFVNKSSNEIIFTGVVCPQNNIRITWEKDTIRKQENGTITVTVNPKNSVGSFDCPIKISTIEKGKSREYTLTVKGSILESKEKIYGMKEGNLRYKNNQKTGLKLTPTTVLVDTFFFYNEWTDTMTFVAEDVPPIINISYLTPKIAPFEEGILVFSYKTELKKDWGLVYDKFSVKTNDPERSVKTLYVMGDIYDDFSSWTPAQMKNAPKVKMSEEVYNFGTVTEGENAEHTFTITNVGKSTLYIRKVKGSCSCTVVQPEKTELAPGESTSMKAVFRTHNKTGNQSRPADVITNDPERPKITLTLEGHVLKKSE